MHYGVPIVQYCGYMVSRNNHHDMHRARQFSKLRACIHNSRICLIVTLMKCHAVDSLKQKLDTTRACFDGICRPFVLVHKLQSK